MNYTGTKIFYTNNKNHLNNKKQHDFLGKKRQIMDFKSDNMKEFSKLMEKVKNNSQSHNNTEILPRKLEFKLSHIIQGENTKYEADQALIKSTQREDVFNDNFIDSLLGWKNPEKVGPGLNNLGNTCFLNSVLQALFYTPCLRNYIKDSAHTKSCQVKGICFICEYGKLINLFGK
jgi:hypothetical protein